MDSFRLTTSSGAELNCYRWLPETAAVATIQIAHGMGEHAARYDWTAEQLNASGYAVYAADHRGHGNTRINNQDTLLGDLGDDGWNQTIADMHDLRLHIGSEHPDLKQVLMGHSMGSMLTQQYLYRFADGLSAAIISGSPGFGSPFQLWLSHTIARFERWRHGDSGESALLDRMIFGNANDPFDNPDANGFEWLSRDEAEVRKYIDDPLCGFVLRTGSLANMFAGTREARRKKSVAALPQALPVYIFSGEADPVHGEQKGLDRLLKAYRRQISSLTYKLYPDGRHEMLNETNRQEVIDELTRWLATTLG
jgi:alpha-beta hydrolase superfamily lysophospholipase